MFLITHNYRLDALKMTRGFRNFLTVTTLSSFFLAIVFLNPSQVLASQYFTSLYNQPVPAGTLDGTEKTFLVNGYSTSHWPSEDTAWPAVLQQMLDEHTGATTPDERIYHVFSHTVGSTPIAWWSKQEGNLGCDDDGNHIQDSISWYVNPGSKLENGAPPATILLAQQSLQWAFDCTDRSVGIADENDTINIEHGAAEIEYFVDQFVMGGIQSVYLSKHIYQKNQLSIPTFTEMYSVERALEFVEELKPGPHMWYDTKEEVYPWGYHTDGRHPKEPAANLMAIHWYLVLAGDDANPQILDKYAAAHQDLEEYAEYPPLGIPSADDPPPPVAENITNLTTASGNEYQVVVDDDPYDYGMELPARIYIDTILDIYFAPDHLVGETFIKTYQEDFSYTGDSFLSFDIDQNATVYVAHTDQIGTKPAWLDSFVDTSEDVSNDKYTFSLYAKDFPAGTVTLGGNGGDGRDKMYFVIVKNHENASPVANDDEYSTDEDLLLSVDASAGILANDTDEEGDPLTAVLEQGPTYGTLTLNSDGSFEYDSDPDFNGTDTFTYEVSDGTTSSTATVTITVNPIQDPPTAVDDAASTPPETSVTIDVLANDLDPDGDTLSVTAITQPASGSATLNPDSTVTYTPDPGTETDSFTYEMTDGIDTSSATVAITVNHPPVADDQSVTTDEDTSVAITLTASDPDGDTLTYSIVTPPANGTLTGTAPDITYTPNPDYNGSDSFTFQAEDSFGNTDEGAVSLTINAVNDAPVALDGSATTQEETAVDITLEATDVDGDTLSYIIVDLPTDGTISSDDGDNLVTYTPNSGFSGSDSFTFRANDGLLNSNIATISIAVESLSSGSGILVEVVSVSTGEAYTVGTAALNELVYIDTDYVINSLDPLFDQQAMVQTAWVDRGVSDPNHLTLNFGQSVDVYIAFDTRLSSLPSWMDDGSWTLVPETVSTSYGNDSPRKVYKKNFASGEHVFGGNDGRTTGARSNYFVIVIPSL